MGSADSTDGESDARALRGLAPLRVVAFFLLLDFLAPDFPARLLVGFVTSGVWHAAGENATLSG